MGAKCRAPFYRSLRTIRKPNFGLVRVLSNKFVNEACPSTCSRSTPSPVPPRLMKTPGRATLSPKGEREVSSNHTISSSSLIPRWSWISRRRAAWAREPGPTNWSGVRAAARRYVDSPQASPDPQRPVKTGKSGFGDRPGPKRQKSSLAIIGGSSTTFSGPSAFLKTCASRNVSWGSL